MRTEIKKGLAWFSNFDWALRFTMNPTDAIITSDNPVIMEGNALELESALGDSRTLIYFPLSWQMCLIGHHRQDIADTSEFPPDGLQHFRALCARYTDQFLFSPTKQRIVDGTLGVNIE
jgi:hypothetical protein